MQIGPTSSPFGANFCRGAATASSLVRAVLAAAESVSMSKLVDHGEVRPFAYLRLITFCVSRRRRKMYCGHERLCVCVCLSVRGRTPTLLHRPGCNLRRGGGCPLVVHYWADLQSGHGLRCYGNITRSLVTSLRPSRDMTT